mmetsp:Transcript_11818/g.25868  ORF Transcript_11818/g.25868 Transcript_11818/m.25868 type:complete len:805 (-) Transcript_11818:28-2442(-)
MDERHAGGQVGHRVPERGGAGERPADELQVLPAHHLLPDIRQGQGAGQANQPQREGGRARVRVRQRHQRAPLCLLGRPQLLPGQRLGLQAQVHHHRVRRRVLRVLRLHPAVPAVRRATHAQQRPPRARVGREHGQQPRRARRGDHAQQRVHHRGRVHPFRRQPDRAAEQQCGIHRALPGRVHLTSDGRELLRHADRDVARADLGRHPGLHAHQPHKLRGRDKLRQRGRRHRAGGDLRRVPQRRGHVLLRPAGGGGHRPHQGQHIARPPLPPARGRAAGLLRHRGRHHIPVPARADEPGLPGRRREPQQGQSDNRQRDHPAPDRGGVHGQRRVRERAQAGHRRHQGRLRHLRARHAHLRRLRAARGRAQQPAPRAPFVRVSAVHHHRHLPAELLRAHLDPQRRHADHQHHHHGGITGPALPGPHQIPHREAGQGPDHAGGDPVVHDRGPGDHRDPPRAPRASRPLALRAPGDRRHAQPAHPPRHGPEKKHRRRAAVPGRAAGDVLGGHGEQDVRAERVDRPEHQQDVRPAGVQRALGAVFDHPAAALRRRAGLRHPRPPHGQQLDSHQLRLVLFLLRAGHRQHPAGVVHDIPADVGHRGRPLLPVLPLRQLRQGGSHHSAAEDKPQDLPAQAAAVPAHEAAQLRGAQVHRLQRHRAHHLHGQPQARLGRLQAPHHPGVRRAQRVFIHGHRAVQPPPGQEGAGLHGRGAAVEDNGGAELHGRVGRERRGPVARGPGGRQARAAGAAGGGGRGGGGDDCCAEVNTAYCLFHVFRIPHFARPVQCAQGAVCRFAPRRQSCRYTNIYRD